MSEDVQILSSPDGLSLPLELDSEPSGPPTSTHPTPSPSPPPSVNVIRIPPMKRPHNDSRLFVDVPLLSPEDKAEYRDAGATLDDVALGTIEAVVGEYEEDGELYYYARFSDGVIHKFVSSQLKRKQPELVESYEHKRDNGTLPPFDPSSRDVHPASRVRVVLRLNGSTKNDQGSRDESESAIFVSDSSEDDDVGESELDDDSDASVLPTRKSTRLAGANNDSAQLPFSPKKTRSRKVIILDDDEENDNDDDDELLIASPSVRRSTRTRTAVVRKTFVDSGDEDYAPTPKSKVAKKKAQPKASRPAYGRIRTMDELKYDPDPSTKPLRAHRAKCEKCQRLPTPQLKKRRKAEDEEEEDLGGWVQCLKCPVAAHWGCLAKTQQAEILKAALERDWAEWRSQRDRIGSDGEILDENLPQKRKTLEPHLTTEFLCGGCMKGGFCLSCKEVVLEPDSVPRIETETTSTEQKDDPPEDVEMEDATQVQVGTAEQPIELDATPEPKQPAKPEPKPKPDEPEGPDSLFFRCILCRRMSHYAHLPQPPFTSEEYNEVELADYYQRLCDWKCADCVTYVYLVEHIIAWRPFPEDAKEKPLARGEVPNYKTPLPREYLVKWKDRSYRRIQWVPHMWLLAKTPNMLRNFLLKGSHVELLPEPATEEVLEHAGDGDAVPMDVQEDDKTPPAPKPAAPSGSIPDAERRIRPAWKTVDRVLDVLIWSPEKRTNRRKLTKDLQAQIDEEYEAVFKTGEQPSADLTETVAEWEKRNRKKISDADAHRVIFAFIKWDDLGYDDASWDAPPKEGTAGYAAFEHAFTRFVASRSVIIEVRSDREQKLWDNRPKDGFRARHAFTTQSLPQLDQQAGLSLMPFQVDGVNWLCNNWWNLQHCILADEMGLGKTVQVVTFIGAIMKLRKAWPALVVVPNSTITNWVREFERWAPNLRVCPFYGEARARDIIKQYELYHWDSIRGTTGAKYHVLVTTYETITGKDFTTVFKKSPRWEMLVVDEGQRLKSDTSLIFKKLNELNTIHRVILTGTPLNNNIRELFNLMNFLDPNEWNDLENLAKEHEELTEESVKELHNRLRPYFLRRVKSEVLQLPPKNEVIVPVSMAPLQREVYKSILSQNIELLRSLSAATSGAKVNTTIKRTNLNNILMQLRKCLQHPYLISQEIEPKGLAPLQAHEKLIDGSAKLRILKVLLPKLKARGHRVLLFSQFVIALDIVEDFLIGERIKYLRLDGNTKQSERQKGMDEFNKPGSDVFIYLLTTRAGGVGINLWSADTVIIFDPDFNPHQDLQAIARAHRYGQKKTCLVFKLMVKESAEERIMQTGKKKLVLDHLIVQKMDDDDGKEDVQNILMFGAQALFEGGGGESKEIQYSENDIENLIERTEKEEPEEVQSGGNKDNALFSFAKVWSAEKDSLEELSEEAAQQAEQVDSWAQTLERIANERQQAHAEEALTSGRGVRRKAAATFNQPSQSLPPELADTPTKDKNKEKKKKNKGKGKATFDDSDFHALVASSDSESEAASVADHLLLQDLNDLQVKEKRKRKSNSPGPSNLPPSAHKRPSPPNVCGLCGTVHEEGQCYMTEKPENLAEYRKILFSHTIDESIEERRAAIAIIDETLHRLGKMHLIYGQPLHLVDTSDYPITNQQRPDPAPSTSVPTSFMQNVQTSRAAAAKFSAVDQFRHFAPQPQPSRPVAQNGVVSVPKPAPIPVPGPHVPHQPTLLSAGLQPRRSIPGTAITAYPVIVGPNSSTSFGTLNISKMATPKINGVKNSIISTNAAAGPSNPKRARSPSNTSKPKKLKPDGQGLCPFCQNKKHTTMESCPFVANSTSERIGQTIRDIGPKNMDPSILREIMAIFDRKAAQESSAKISARGKP